MLVQLLQPDPILLDDPVRVMSVEILQKVSEQGAMNE